MMLVIICSGDIDINSGPKKNNKISFCHWNFNGIAAHNFLKVSLLEAMATKYECDIICRSEAFLDSSINLLDDRIKIEGYNLIRADHLNDNKRGGVWMYFKEHLSILRCDNLCNLPECSVTEIKMGTKKSFLMCLFRSRSQSSDEFDTFWFNLNLFLSNINDLNPASSVIGDFNVSTSKWWSSDKETFEGRAIHSLTASTGYTQLID